MLINLIFVFTMGFLLLAMVFLLQKQSMTRPVAVHRRSARSAQWSAPAPAGRPLVDFRASAPVAEGMPESAIKAVTVYTHDRATSERLLQCYRLSHGRGWGETADQVIRDLVRDRR